MKIATLVRHYFQHAWSRIHSGELALVIVALVSLTILALAPTGYENPNDHALRARAEILSVDNRGVKNYGILQQGEQIAVIRVLDGPEKGREGESTNILFGKADMDKLFEPGDIALVVINKHDDGTIAALTLVDHWRLDLEFALIGGFFLLLLLYGGWTGLKTMVAFAFSAVAIWKILIPAFLAGFEPVLASLVLVILLSGLICFLVGGFNRAGLAAFLGSVGGTLTSALLALVLAHPFELNGAIRPFSETLRFGGFEHLDLTGIFLAGTFLASSGAIMDLAIDVAVALEEVHEKRPGLGFRTLLKSGLSLGRKVFGTMTTTLLLAYTGGFTSLLMVFMAQGIPFENMFNLVYVSSEIFHTMIGSFGLVLVAPCTALIAAWLFSTQKTRLDGFKNAPGDRGIAEQGEEARGGGLVSEVKREQ